MMRTIDNVVDGYESRLEQVVVRYYLLAEEGYYDDVLLHFTVN